MESFARDDEERRLEEVVRNMKPEKREKLLEQEATIYLDMVDTYSPDEESIQEKY